MKGGELMDEVLCNGRLKDYKAAILIKTILEAVNYLHNTQEMVHR